MEQICSKCGRPIRPGEWYYYRKTWSGVFGEPMTIERYCRDCASEMVDEHTHNHLLVAKAKDKKE